MTVPLELGCFFNLPRSSFSFCFALGTIRNRKKRQQTFKERQYLPGPGELGASERRVTLLLLTIILTHMVLTLPARVCRNKILIYSPQELVSTNMIHVKIARTFAIVSFVRSSNSHPDLLLTHHHHHHHPLFFRSHRSSTMDLHFLNQYSYIKGNHCTGLICWLHVYLIFEQQDITAR